MAKAAFLRPFPGDLRDGCCVIIFFRPEQTGAGATVKVFWKTIFHLKNEHLKLFYKNPKGLTLTAALEGAHLCRRKMMAQQ
jgi:hypothetical protein